MVRLKKIKFRVTAAAMIIVALAGLLISFYNYNLTNITVQSQKETNLDLFTGRILNEIEQLEVILETTVKIMNDEHIAIAKAIDYILAGAPEEDLTSEALQRLAEPLEILELNIVNSDGILTHSNVPSLIGFNYNDYEATRIYITLTTGTLDEIREEPRQSVLDDEEYGDTNHYAGIPRTGGGFIQVGFDANIIWRLYDEFDTSQSIRDIEIIDDGYGMVITEGVISAHPDSSKLGMDVSDEAWFKAVSTGYGYEWLEIDGIKYYARHKNENQNTVIGLIPEDEFFKESRDLLTRSLTVTAIATIVIMPIMYMLTSGIINITRKSPPPAKETPPANP